MMIIAFLLRYFPSLIFPGDLLLVTGFHAVTMPKFLFSILGCFFFQPATGGVDAFSQDWRGHNNWLHPPIYLIPRVIKFLEYQKTEGTLILPFWSSLYFWSMLCEDGANFKPFVLDWKTFPNGRSWLLQGRSKNSLFDIFKPDFELLALRVSFKFSLFFQ